MASAQYARPQEAPLPTRIKQWRDGITALAYFVAITITPPLRSKQGFNVLQPGAAFVMTGIMLAFNALLNFSIALPFIGRLGAHETSDALKIYALFYLGYVLWNRRIRWKALRTGERWHSYSSGISRLESVLSIRPDLVSRFADPIAAFLGGMFAKKLGLVSLGAWFEIGAVCLYIVENYAHERAVERDLAVLDALIESEVAGATAAHFEGQGDGPVRARSVRDTHGIQTGPDPELEAVIARRRRESAARSDEGLNATGVRP